jgi:cell division protease FtsH
MNKQHQWNIWYFIGALLLLTLFQSIWTTWRTVEPIPYSEFLKLLDQKQIIELTVSQEQITGRLKEPINGRQFFVTNRVEPALAEQIEKSGAKFTGSVENTFLSTLLSWIMPVLFFVGIWYFAFRRFAERQGIGGLVNVGKSKARVLVERNTGVTFDDVAGLDEAKLELEEIVSFLKEKDKYGRLGARIPKGVLLVGPLEPARRCSPRRWPVRLACRSFRSPVPSSSRCSLVWAQRWYETFLSRRARPPHVSFLSTSLMRWGGREAVVYSVGTTRKSKR